MKQDIWSPHNLFQHCQRCRCLGDGDDSLGGGGLLGPLCSGELDLRGDPVEVTAALAGQAAPAVGVLLGQLQTLEGLREAV